MIDPKYVEYVFKESISVYQHYKGFFNLQLKYICLMFFTSNESSINYSYASMLMASSFGNTHHLVN